MVGQESLLKEARRIVVKVGSALVTNDGRGLDVRAIERWAGQIAALRAMGREVLLVSSGAIAEGVLRIGWETRPTRVCELQAAAAVGQMGLAQAYEEHFGRHGIKTAQVLLTHANLADREQYLNARMTLIELLGLGIVPVINENDTVVTEEIKVGDNDTLGALVTNLVEADVLVILTDQRGLFTADPRSNPDAEFVQFAQAGDPALEKMAGGAASTLSKGGMITKIKAARVLMVAGIPLVVCDGHRAEAIVDAAAGEDVGTLFVAAKKPHEITPKKLWIALGDAARGALAVDDGAKAALIERGSSLLSVGVRSVEGRFEANDIVDIKDATGHLFARGKVAFASDEAALAIGRTRAELQANRLLASLADKPLVHRDELVVFE